MAGLTACASSLFEPGGEPEDDSFAANEIVEAEGREIDLYERHSRHVGYGFYIASRHSN